MNEQEKLKQLKSRRFFELFVIVVLIILLVGGVMFIQQVQRQGAIEVKKVEELPHELVELASLRAELQRRQSDLGQLEKLVLQRSQINEFLSSLETLGARHGARVRVTDLKEQVALDNLGNAVSEGGRQNVEVLVTAVGEPSELLRWLHQVEHMPYLVKLDGWRFRTGLAVRLTTGTSGAPTDSPNGQAVEDEIATGQVDAHLILTMQNDGDS